MNFALNMQKNRQHDLVFESSEVDGEKYNLEMKMKMKITFGLW